MGLQSLNRFHWIILGAFLGVTLAYAWSQMGDNVDTLVRVEANVFERSLMLKDPTDNLPLITNIVIHPPVYSLPDKSDVNVVTFKRLGVDKKTGKKGYWLDRWFIAKIPYRPVMAIPMAAADMQSMTIQSYLTELSRQPSFENIKFRYGWWLIPKNTMMIGGSAGVVLIGGIWPTLLGLMTGAGLGPKKKEKRDSLWGYKSKYAEPKKPGNSTITAADQQKLQNVADAYEKSLAPSGLGMTDAGSDTALVPGAAKTPDEVRKLETAAASATAATDAQEDIEVKNREFYPVIIHHKKDDQEDPKHPEKKPRK